MRLFALKCQVRFFLEAEEFVAAEPFVTKVGSVSTPYYTLDPGHLRYNALSELPLIDTD